jgi:hypothetical protein
MKTLLLSLLIIISALLLIGSTCNAQSKESDRDWIDSLSVKYRMDFIESAMWHDRATLDSMATGISALILYMQNAQKFEATSNDDLVKAIRRYDHERQAQQLRKCAYKEERRLARTNFSAL